MTLSVITTHYNQPDVLEQHLLSLTSQSLQSPHEIVVVDDGSSCDLPEIPQLRYSLIRRPRHPRNYPQYASNTNLGVASATGEAVVILSCHWHVSRDFLGCASELLQQGPRNVVWCAPHATGSAYQGEIPLDRHYHVDNHSNWTFWRDQWLPFDERFDTFGGIHAVPTWAWEMLRARRRFVYDDALRAVHLDAPYLPGTSIVTNIPKSTGLYFEIVREHQSGQEVLMASDDRSGEAPILLGPTC